jgi:hypothetical protein
MCARCLKEGDLPDLCVPVVSKKKLKKRPPKETKAIEEKSTIDGIQSVPPESVPTVELQPQDDISD